MNYDRQIARLEATIASIQEELIRLKAQIDSLTRRLREKKKGPGQFDRQGKTTESNRA